MKKYLLIYKRLLISNWFALLEYRSDFATRIFASLMYSVYHVATVLLLTSKVPSAYGWTRSELLLLAATYSVFISIYHIFISRNLDHLADEIYYGRLDHILLKPIDSQFSVTLWKIDYVNLVRLIFGLSLSYFLVRSMHIALTANIVVEYTMVIFTGVFILYSFWLPFISLTIFNPRLSNIVSLLFQLSSVARYPQEMYARLPVYFFVSLIPLAIIMTTPTKVLLQKFSLGMGLELISVSVILGIFARMVWRYSLRFYTSASS